MEENQQPDMTCTIVKIILQKLLLTVEVDERLSTYLVCLRLEFKRLVLRAHHGFLVQIACRI